MKLIRCDGCRRESELSLDTKEQVIRPARVTVEATHAEPINWDYDLCPDCYRAILMKLNPTSWAHPETGIFPPDGGPMIPASQRGHLGGSGHPADAGQEFAAKLAEAFPPQHPRWGEPDSMGIRHRR